MANGYLLSIGLNSVDPMHYSGWNGKLNAAEKDAIDVQAIAKNVGFKTDLVKSKDATIEMVTTAILNAANNLASGDIFLLYYSGHGGQVPDLDGEEDDGMDETWCLYDGQLLDDKLYELWSYFKEDVRVFVLSDSCHSGTVVKLAGQRNDNCFDLSLVKKAMPPEIALGTYMDNQDFYNEMIGVIDKAKSKLKPPLANIRLISGCQDNQSSYDGAFNSSFTEKLKLVWNGGMYSGNYAGFHKAIVNLLPAYQSPNHLLMGKPNLSYDLQIPFTI